MRTSFVDGFLAFFNLAQGMWSSVSTSTAAQLSLGAKKKKGEMSFSKSVFDNALWLDFCF